MSTPTIPNARAVAEHVDLIGETHPLPWSIDEAYDGELVDALNCEVTTSGIEAPLAAAVNAYALIPDLLAERVRLLSRVAELDGALHLARGSAAGLRDGICRALGITEHTGDLDLITRLTAAVHGVGQPDAR